MSINMQHTTIFYYTKVMKINPIFPSVCVQGFHHSCQQLYICLIHNAGNRSSQYCVTSINNKARKKDSNNAINPFKSGKIKQNEAGNNANC